MKRVLLLATTTGYQIRSFGEAADKLGIQLVFVSDRCDQLDDPWWDGAVPVRFHDPDAAERAVVGALRSSPPDGVLAVGDRPTLLAARLTSSFGLPGNPPESAVASRNKQRSRQALADAGLPVPAFRVVALAEDAHRVASELTYPVVVKPLALSASRGVMRADTEAEFVTVFARLRALLQSPDIRMERDEAHDYAMVESFVPGREVAIEGVLTNGSLHVLAMFDKPDPLDGPFFEETIYVTPSRESLPVQEAIAAQVAAAARALGLRHGPVHAECRLSPSPTGGGGPDGVGVYVLEVAARPIGGLCSKALRCAGASGATVSLEEVLLRHAVGEDVSGFSREPDASGVMMIPIPHRGVFKDVRGESAASAVPGVEEIRITAKPDSVLVPLPEGHSYLGFIFARRDSPAAVEQALRDAHARLEFRIDRELAVTS